MGLGIAYGESIITLGEGIAAEYVLLAFHLLHLLGEGEFRITAERPFRVAVFDILLQELAFEPRLNLPTAVDDIDGIAAILVERLGDVF